ncbi:hypothetical protein [Luteimicrobium subarcticum]|uniref:hypothetical protein n=1 Tax=Luteimicrobium subarcticum TaxID=620910 RepID=UPI0012FD3268|nr:hypothetical protein [Luteimicrobium subarcticum]
MGLDIDPTPGDPVLVLAGGRDYLDVASAIDDAASALDRLSVDGTVSAAVDAVMDRKEDVIADIRKAHCRYEAAGNALVSYAGVLDRVQSDTLAALNTAITALDDSAAATGTKSRWQQLADDATDPHEKTVYQHKADLAGDRVSAAHGAVNAAKGDIDTAVHDRDRAADNAISQIEEITSHDDLNDSWWDNWGSKVVAAIADIADVISLVTAADGDSPAGTTRLAAIDLDDRHETVYNIHVHTHHTYYVLAGTIPVLVHNAAGHDEAAREAAKKAANDVITNVKGASGKDIDEVRGMIPADWSATTPKKVPPGGTATKYEPPIKNTGQQIIYESGWPGHPDPLHTGPYLRVSDGRGAPVRVPLAGNPTLAGGSQ